MDNKNVDDRIGVYMKIIVTDAKTISNNEEYFNTLKSFGQLEIYPLSSDEQIKERIADADIIVCNKNVFNEENLKYAKKLKYIGLFATGYNNIDVEYCGANGITVCNAGSYSTDAVAQHTFALILNYYNKINQYNELVKEEGWIKSDVFSPFVYDMNELTGKTIGLVGYGNIARKVGKIANAFGMKVLAYKRNPLDEEGVSFVDFDTVIRESDIVSVHCPLNEESKLMFNGDVFAKMKKTAYFVNTARGGVMNEDELADALNNEVIAGAAIDVLTIEPMEADCKLLRAKNITITPHVAWAPIETRDRLMGIVCDNIKAFLDGTPQNVVSVSITQK